MLFAPEDEKMGLAAYLSEKVGGRWAVPDQPTETTTRTYDYTKTWNPSQATQTAIDPTEPSAVDNPKIISTNPDLSIKGSDYIRRSQRSDPLGLNGEFS